MLKIVYRPPPPHPQVIGALSIHRDSLPQINKDTKINQDKELKI